MWGFMYLHSGFYRWLMDLLYCRDYRDLTFLSSFIKPGHSVIDLCAGDCFVRKFITCRHYEGIDSSYLFYCSAFKKGINFTCADVSKMFDFPRRDAILLLNSLYQFNDPQGLIRKMIDSGATVIISEPYKNEVDAKASFWKKLFLFLLEGKNVSRNKFNEKKLSRLFNLNRFDVIAKFEKNIVGVKFSA